MSEYQVLARKYRPKELSELIGQDVLVKTLTNAITQNRIPHAFILTGIRGVGKTSTARIIARSLLCTGENDSLKEATLNPCGVCANCKGISEDNHVDVIEVDAASRTGVNDIREIIDQVAYSPVLGRYKIYIIDEVHMLSKSAFNALLKTLEEPPAHVKFIFATTEIRKIPVTILSRCMRFDLPRVSSETLITHFKKIAESENIEADEESFKLISAASEGSVRDGLSLLDQAIAISSDNKITGEEVARMIGLADRESIYELLKLLISGDFENSLEKVKEIYDKGNEAINIIKDLQQITHNITLHIANPKLLERNLLSEFELEKTKEIIEIVDLPKLARIWQILSKGIEESANCSSGLMAAEMTLIKACYAAQLPTPEKILKQLNEDSADNQSNNVTFLNQENGKQEKEHSSLLTEKKTPNLGKEPELSSKIDERITVINSVNNINNPNEKSSSFSETDEFEGLKKIIKIFRDKGENLTASWLEEAKLINFDNKNRSIDIAIEDFGGLVKPSEIVSKLQNWTGENWKININKDLSIDAKSINSANQEEVENRKKEAINSDAVQSILNQFEGAEIVSVTEVVSEEFEDENKINQEAK